MRASERCSTKSTHPPPLPQLGFSEDKSVKFTVVLATSPTALSTPPEGSKLHGSTAPFRDLLTS